MVQTDPLTWLPWAEANQGTLSIFALIVALAVAVRENILANKAKAEALAAEQKAEARDRKALAEQERHGREARIIARKEAVSGYVNAGVNIIGQLTRAATVEKYRLREENSEMHAAVAEDFILAGRRIEGALFALERIAPPDPDLILATRAALETFASWGALGSLCGRVSCLDGIKERMKHAEDASKALADRSYEIWNSHHDDVA